MTSPQLAESYQFCRQLTRRTADNFRFSFLVLPRDRYNAMCALYAFMRITDDIGDDETVSLPERIALLETWRSNVTAALSGDAAAHPALPALTDIVQTYRIPAEYLFAVMEGVSRDLHPAVFHTFAELADYCYHVAGAVGLCCIHIWGFRSPEAVPLAIDCGTAFQLTNILRDVGEDARAGRCYLPDDDLQRFDLTRAEVLAGGRDVRMRRLVQFEAERARGYYDRAAGLFPLLEPSGRPVLRVMLDLYGNLLRELERRDFDVFGQRVRLSCWKKLWLVARALCLRDGALLRP